MKTITVEYDDVTPNTIEHRQTNKESVLAIGNRRLPAALTDKQGLLDALAVSDRIAQENRAWRASIVAALNNLVADEMSREHAAT
ncbi:hypothetical protein ACQP1V_43135 (plasmid) [Microtetraspora malaysiensis]|uniref:hypothetical protein n=1 Tax=Microtetraspora malaysiensis TaxID=161358 RepID=UPI003D92CCA0